VTSDWSKRVELQSALDPKLQWFLRTRGKDAQTPEPGAPCNGGAGSPG